MPKEMYNNIRFDSTLEVEYYKYLIDLVDKGEVIKFEYHPKEPIYLNTKNRYYPDYIVEYSDRLEIVENKGYSQYSYIKDNYIHQTMLEMNESDLRIYVMKNGWDVKGRNVIYRKIKYLKAYGFVDWDFKNPNTIANKRKEKITELTSEVKALREFKKGCLRYFCYLGKLRDGKKLTKSQQQWYDEFEKANIPNNIIVLDIKE